MTIRYRVALFTTHMPTPSPGEFEKYVVAQKEYHNIKAGFSIANPQNPKKTFFLVL